MQGPVENKSCLCANSLMAFFTLQPCRDFSGNICPSQAGSEESPYFSFAFLDAFSIIAKIFSKLFSLSSHHHKTAGCRIFEKFPDFGIDYATPDNYALAGEQTAAGGEVKAIAEKISAELGVEAGGMKYFEAVSKELNARLVSEDDRDFEICERSAEIILQSGYATGCHDWAIAAAAVLVEMGYPVIYVDTIKEGQDESESGPYAGHAFLEVYDHRCKEGKGCWMLYDPTFSTIYSEYDPMNFKLPDSTNAESSYLVFAKGKDPADMGINSLSDLEVCLDVVEKAPTETYEGLIAPFEYKGRDLVNP